MRMLVAVCMFSAPVLAAGPLNPAWVAADASWVVHIDVEAVMASSVGPFLAHPPASVQLKLDEVRAKVGLDALRDIKSVTVYGKRETPEEGVVIIASTEAIDALLERFKGQGHYARLDENGTVFHTWAQGGETRYATVRDGPDHSRVLYLADSREQIDAGLRVVDGAAPHRAADEPAPGAGSVLFVHSKGIPQKLREQASTTFIKLVDGLLMDMGESAGQLYANVTLVANSDENVAAVRQGVQGVLALARLGAASDAELASLCNSIRITTEGRNVAARLTCDVGDALRELRKKADGNPPAAHRKDGNAGAVSTNTEGER